MTTSVDLKEIQAFSKDAARWWDEDGPFAPLHRLNPVRMGYIRQQICGHFDLDQQSLKPFQGLKILDVGCGGGLVCEPLARLGATVTGIDADENAIAVAREHADWAGLDIEYLNETSESLPSYLSSRRKPGSRNPKQSDPVFQRDDDNGYDVVLALEIIEHVTDPAEFVKSCARLVKPGGMIMFSTLNRTAKSYALGIVAAEYILRWVPQGTHSWKKFVKPSELARYARAADLDVQGLAGLVFDPLKNEFKISKTDLDVNYFLRAVKD